MSFREFLFRPGSEPIDVSKYQVAQPGQYKGSAHHWLLVTVLALAAILALTAVVFVGVAHGATPAKPKQPLGLDNNQVTRDCSYLYLHTDYIPGSLTFDQASNSFKATVGVVTIVKLAEWQVLRTFKCNIKTTHARLKIRRWNPLISKQEFSFPAPPCADGSPRQADGSCLVQTPPQVVVPDPAATQPTAPTPDCTIPPTKVEIGNRYYACYQTPDGQWLIVLVPGSKVPTGKECPPPSLSKKALVARKIKRLLYGGSGPSTCPGGGVG